MGRQGRPLGGCEHGVALPNARGRITSKDKPWELAGQIAAGRGLGETRGGGVCVVVRECGESLSEQSHLYFRRQRLFVSSKATLLHSGKEGVIGL